jgi:homoserine dehydrogenase
LRSPKLEFNAGEVAERLKATVSKTVIPSYRDRGFESHPLRHKTVNLVLVGFGRVGRAFYRLISEKRELVRRRYGLSPDLRSILNSSGGVASDQGLTLSQGSDVHSIELSEHPLWQKGLRLDRVFKEMPPGVLVECTPSNIQTGEPGLGHLHLALDNGWHIVTADKGALVVNFQGLREKAAQRGLGLGASGAAGAALPALDVGRVSLAGTEITSVEGILNGTTNYILTQMAQGISYEEALQDAQTRGIAEPDPSLDVEGWDTAAKLVIIANVVMGLSLNLKDVAVEPIASVSRQDCTSARKEGKSLKLLGRVQETKGSCRAEVKVEAIDRSHPLFGVDGANKGIVYFTDTMGAITLTGGKSDPRGAAAALLKDIINLTG